MFCVNFVFGYVVRVCVLLAKTLVLCRVRDFCSLFFVLT